MEALVRLVKRHKGVFATAAAAAIIMIVLVVASLRRSVDERRDTEEARARASAAEKEAGRAASAAEKARSAAAASEAAARKIGSQAAPEFVAKAARALIARRWAEAREAAAQAVTLDPKLGAAWFEKGRAALQAGEFAAAADCFAKAQADNRLGEALKARAGRLAALARQYAGEQQATGKLTMPQQAQLAKALSLEGERVLAGWFLELAGQKFEALKARLDAAEERLKLDNPKLDAVPKPSLQRNAVTWVLRDLPALADISALEGLPLTSLDLEGTSVADLGPLEGMPLRGLNIWRTPVADLAPLKGMPLQSLRLPARVQSLAPLAGAPLEVLAGSATKVADLSPLAGMPLRTLSIVCDAPDISALRDMPLELLRLGPATKVRDFSVLASLKSLKTFSMFQAPIRDLSVLKGAPIENLQLIACHDAVDLTPLHDLPLKALDLGQVADRTSIAALAGMDLDRLFIDRTSITNLAPLKGMKLTQLRFCSYRPTHDYSVLEGMPLVELMVGWLPHRWDAAACLVPDTLGFLKQMETLKTLEFGLQRADLAAYDQVLKVGDALRAANPNYKAGAFYRLEGAQLTEVWIQKCGVSDLSPLKELKLTSVVLSGTPVKDLTPLASMALRRVHLRNTPATDLTPLVGMPLKVLDITGSPVSDLTPVKAAPIEELMLAGSKVTDCGQLKGMKLRKLWLDEKMPYSGIRILRGMDTLTHINDTEVKEFWKAHDPANHEL